MRMRRPQQLSKMETRNLLDLCSKDVAECDFVALGNLLSSGVTVDAHDGDGMTALMHAAFKGNLGACRKLLEHGADVNWNGHKDGYTVLMFATIAGHCQVVQLLLDSGARTSTRNNVSKTAAQLGAFVGQHECVRVINNHFAVDELDYYTTPQGLEKSPKLDPALSPPLHALITMPTLHPVKIIQTLQSTDPALLPAHMSVCKVLRLLGERMEGAGRETHSLKLHCVGFVMGQCAKNGVNSVLKLLLTYREDGTPENLDRFLRQCLQEYPHVHSPLLKQLVATLARAPPGGPPSALSLFQQMVFGKMSEAEEGMEGCSACGRLMETVKKCSKCKQAFYCGVECQTLAWSVGNHRKLCKKWTSESSGGERDETRADPEQKKNAVASVTTEP